MIDVVFINANAQQAIYQDLSNKFTAIEPPTWSLLLAQACISKDLNVVILDCLAENLSKENAALRIKELNPRLICFTTYGPNPNSGTTQMEGTVEYAKFIKESYPEYLICSVGSHTQALPLDVLSYDFIDFVCVNEGVRTIINLLNTDLKTDLHTVKGLGFKKDGELILNDAKGTVIPTELMDIEMPGYAWHLLPFKNKPLDLYRSHNWVTGYIENKRSPYVALYSSLGCKFKCEHCMINVISNEDNKNNNIASKTNIMRFWSPEWTLKRIDELLEMGVTTWRFSDEMAMLNKKYYVPILEGMKKRGLENKINTWLYARADSILPRLLELTKQAGISYLAIGVENANQEVRQEISKGSFNNINIKDIIKRTREHGISVGANYIFGMPTDSYQTMQETLDLSIEMNTEFANFYCAAALPASPLYFKARENGWKLPNKYSEYSFHSYDTVPLPTQYLKPEEVLKFRDEAWNKYFSRPEYLSMIKQKFGEEAEHNIIEQTKIKLKRRLLGD